MRAEESPLSITPQDLYNYLVKFIAENSRHQSTQYRWLADFAKDLSKQAYNVANGNYKTIEKATADFRLLEIEREVAELEKKKEKLEEERKRQLLIIEATSQGLL